MCNLESGICACQEYFGKEQRERAVFDALNVLGAISPSCQCNIFLTTGKCWHTNYRHGIEEEEAVRKRRVFREAQKIIADRMTETP